MLSYLFGLIWDLIVIPIIFSDDRESRPNGQVSPGRL